MRLYEMMNKKQLKMIANIVDRNSGKRKMLGTKPRKGDWVQDIQGRKYEIHSVNKGYVYANTGTSTREVFALTDLQPDRNQDLWIEKMDESVVNESKFKAFLQETSVQSALDIDEPEVGKKYDDEAVADRKSRLLAAIKQLRGQTVDDEAKEAMMADLNDKLDKWENVDSETAPPDPPPPKDDGSVEKDDPGSHDDPEPSEQPRGPEKEREEDHAQDDKDRDEKKGEMSREEDQDDEERARANDKQAQKQNLAAKKKKQKNEGRLIKSRIFKL
jgi:hypothetical protein